MTDEPKQPGVTLGSQKPLVEPTIGSEINVPLTDDHVQELFFRHSDKRLTKEDAWQPNFCTFHGYPAANAATSLAKCGLPLTYGDMIVLKGIINIVGSSPELKVTKTEQEYEEKLLRTAIVFGFSAYGSR